MAKAPYQSPAQKIEMWAIRAIIAFFVFMLLVLAVHLS